jgi:DNA-nicking Smr family endonuclease
MTEGSEDDEGVELPIEDSLDLHPFNPRDVKTVVEEYLVQCRLRGFAEVRIIHGRGTGVQRAIVQSLLAKSPHVAAFHDAESERGGWGATVVELRPESHPA